MSNINIEQETIKFSHAQRKIIANLIGNIKKKKYLIEIFNIIQQDPSSSYVENNNGLHMHFDKLNAHTYKKIDDYLKNLKNNKCKILATTSETSLSDKSDSHPYSNDEYSSHHASMPKLKLSNKERNLLNRKKYDKAISEYNESDN